MRPLGRVCDSTLATRTRRGGPVSAPAAFARFVNHKRANARRYKLDTAGGAGASRLIHGCQTSITRLQSRIGELPMFWKLIVAALTLGAGYLGWQSGGTNKAVVSGLIAAFGVLCG